MRRFLGIILLLSCALFMFCAASPAAKSRLIGTWKGHWIRGGDSMAVTLHLVRDSTGKYAATFDSDRLRVSGIPFSDVQVHGCCDVRLVLRGDRTTATFRGTVAGNTLKGRFVEESTEGDFAYTRATSTRPAFEERSLTFTNGDVRLSGSLLVPRGTKSVACVVFLHGSGGEGRWASRFLATQLATHGIAALIYDKRGVGQSSGDWRAATLEDLAGDAAAAVNRLRQESRILPRRIGIHGHSQGGTLAPLVVAQSPDIAFIIGSAAAGLPPDSVEVFSILNSLYPRATSARDSAEAREYVTELVAVAYEGRPRARLDSLAGALRDRPWFFAPPAPDNSYWRFSKIFGAYQPLLWWAKVRVPVLLLYGAEDQRVPARESAERIVATVLRHAPDADVTVRIFPGADHTFRLPPGPGGWPRTAPDYVPILLRWLAAR